VADKQKVYRGLVFLTGLLFLFSAISKLLPIYPFEFLFVREGLLNWSLAPFAARLIISSELITGAGLCLGTASKKVFIPLALLLLIGFSAYLGISLIVKGLQANCGCFGELMPMSTPAALVKNIIMIVVLVVSLLGLKVKDTINYRLITVISISIFSLVFIFSPVHPYVVPTAVTGAPVQADSVKVKTPLQTAAPDTATKKQAKIKTADTLKTKEEKTVSFLTFYPQSSSVYAKYVMYSGKYANPDEGEKIIVVFSLDCEHCLASAKDIALLTKKEKLPQILGIYFGGEEEVPEFEKQSGIKIPYYLADAAHFFPLLSKNPPRVSYIVNGNITANWEGDDFTVARLWAKIKETRSRKK